MATDPTRPLVIAHRGASGYLPEHTPAAKVLGHWQGADYLEQDVVATRDAEFIVFHDIYLDSVTDVAQKFPTRHRDDGHFYVVDFQLREIRELTVTDRGPASESEMLYPAGFPDLSDRFGISTLKEEINLIQELNRMTGRTTGIYTELKNPAWHREHDIDLAVGVLEILSEAGYSSAEDSAYVQCFDATELGRLRNELGISLKLIQLVGEGEESSHLLTADGLREVSETAEGMGPDYSQLVVQGNDQRVMPSPLYDAARQAGLVLHPYTFRRRNLPPYAESLERLLEIFFRDVRVDGVFCDYPDVAVRVRDSLGTRRSELGG